MNKYNIYYAIIMIIGSVLAFGFAIFEYIQEYENSAELSAFVGFGFLCIAVFNIWLSKKPKGFIGAATVQYAVFVTVTTFIILGILLIYWLVI